jgi:hypothetical protein
VVDRYFSDSVRITATSGAERVHKLEASWREPDGTDLRFCLEQVTASVGDEKVEGYRLTTVAGRLLAVTDTAEAALDSVHARLQSFFLDLLSTSAKDEWQLLEVPRG